MDSREFLIPACTTARADVTESSKKPDFWKVVKSQKDPAEAILDQGMNQEPARQARKKMESKEKH
jgi:hypothetical protein